MILIVETMSTDIYSTLPEEYNETETTISALTSRSISAIAATYGRYKFGTWLQTYYLPVVIIVGICGNILSFFVMSLVSNTNI